MIWGDSQSTFRNINAIFRDSVILSFILSDDTKTRTPLTHKTNNRWHDLPHAGASGLAETGMPRYGWPVASSRAANPSAAGSRQEALSEVLGHKSVNYRVYTAAMPNTRLRERRIESRRQLDRGSCSRAVADTRDRIGNAEWNSHFKSGMCKNARHNFDPSPFYMQILYRLFYLKWIPPSNSSGTRTKRKSTL